MEDKEADVIWLTADGNGTLEDGSETFESKFLSAALDVAMLWVDFDQYGSEQAACKALRRRCPRLTPQEYVAALQQAVRLLEEADRCLKPHALQLRKSGLSALEVSLVKELEVAVPGLARFKYSKALFWVWYGKYR